MSTWWPRQESNLHLRLRKPTYYPLYYGAYLGCKSSSYLRIMNQKYLRLLWLGSLGLLLACQPTEDLPQGKNSDPNPEAIDQIMDAWHQAASMADSGTYFGSMASDSSIFIGTDETERWTTSEFKKWSRMYFQRASAWTFVPVVGERHIRSQGEVAWLDEKLDSEHMGRCRGTAILTFDHAANSWKIEHYTLSFSVPNDAVDGLLEHIEMLESKSINL